MLAIQILELCNRRPMSMADLYYAMKVNYPTIRRTLKPMLTLEWIREAKKDGSRVFDSSYYHELIGKDISKLEVKMVKIDLKDYYYVPTSLGQEVMKTWRHLVDIQIEVAKVQLQEFQLKLPVVYPTLKRKHKPRKYEKIDQYPIRNDTTRPSSKGPK